MNNLAISDVTSALKTIIYKGTGYEVSTRAPWEESEANQSANLFLYKIEENAQLKNMDWQGDRSSYQKVKRPPLCLDLYYLFTPFPKDGIEAHKILGQVMLIFHENPILNDIHNYYFDADKDLSDTLVNSFEKIKVTLFSLDMEEMSKIWTMGDKHYKLSVAYHISLVQLAPTVPAVPPGPPVQETGLRVTTISTPTITELDPFIGPVGSELRIIGPNINLTGFKPIVKIGEIEITEFINDNGSDNEISVIVPEELQKGPEQKVTIICNGRESKPAIFRVSPWISLIKPQRGAVDKNDTHSLPFQIHGFDFTKNLQLTVGKKPTENKFINDNLIEAYVPKSLPNGHHNVELIIDGSHTNEKTFEVIPLIKRIQPPQGNVGDPINIRGQRLNGSKIRIRVGPAVIITGENDKRNLLSFNVPKNLNPGKYEVTVIVDGHESNVISFKVIE